MKLKDILEIIENSTIADWRRAVFEDGSTESYCVQDVLIRVNMTIIWKAEKPLTKVTIYYSATQIGTFHIPIGGSTSLRDATSQSLPALIDNIRKTLS